MNYIDVKNFRKYEQLFGDNGPAKIGHVNAVIKALNEVAANSGSGGNYLFAGNSSSVSSINWSQANVQELNLDNDPTLSFSNGVLGQTSTLLLRQNQIGQRTITWPSNVIWSGGVAPSMQTVTSFGPGEFDPSLVSGLGFNGDVIAVAVQADGKILIGGNFTSYDGMSYNRIIRLNSDGSPDNSFLSGSGFSSPYFMTFVNKIIIQPDGKILVAGFIDSYDGTSIGGVVRLMPNGVIDNTFSSTALAPLAMELQADGKIVVGTSDFSAILVRLNSDGSLDGSWNPGSGPDNSVKTIAIQPDGKILIGGNFSSYNSTPFPYITRLNTDGTLDTSFSSASSPNGDVMSIGLQSTGKIIVMGQFSTYGGYSINSIIRLNSNGTIDSTFLSPGAFPTEGVPGSLYSLLIQNDDKIIVGGNFSNYIKSSVTTTVSGIIRINTNGTVDSSFVTGTGLTTQFGFGTAQSLALQPDGKLIVGGTFALYNGNAANSLARISLAFTPPSTVYNKVNFDYNGTDYIGSF